MSPLLHAAWCAMAIAVASEARADASPPALRDCPDCPELVEVPAGTFVMGAAPGEEEREHLAAEFRHRSEPRRTVSVARFRAGRFEVTRRQYAAFVTATGHAGGGCFGWSGSAFEWHADRDWKAPGFPQQDSHPAACVSWEDADAYAHWLSRRTGRP